MDCLTLKLVNPRAEHMNQIYKVQSNLLANVAAQLSNRQIKLSDVCYKPLGRLGKLFIAN